MAIPMAFQIYLKQNPGVQKNIMYRRDLSRLYDISYIESVGRIPRPPNGVSNLFETKSRCSKNSPCVDGIYPVYTIYPTLKSVGHIPRHPNGVSNLFEAKPWCLKKTSCVDGIYPVYTIYPTSNPLAISPAFHCLNEVPINPPFHRTKVISPALRAVNPSLSRYSTT